MGEDDRVGARDRPDADQRQRHVGHGADGERDVLRFGRSGRSGRSDLVAAAVTKIEIELRADGAEIEHEGRALGMHQRRVDRQLALEIPSNHIDKRDRLRGRSQFGLPSPVVVAEDECLAAAAELDRFEVPEAGLARHHRVAECVASGSAEATADGHLDLGRNNVAVCLERAIGGGSDADFASHRSHREPGIGEISVAGRLIRVLPWICLDSGLERNCHRTGQGRGSGVGAGRDRDVVNFLPVTEIHPQEETEGGVRVASCWRLGRGDHKFGLRGTDRRQNGVDAANPERDTAAGLLVESEAPLRQHLPRRGFRAGQAFECGAKLDHATVRLRDGTGGIVDRGLSACGRGLERLAVVKRSGRRIKRAVA